MKRRTDEPMNAESESTAENAVKEEKKRPKYSVTLYVAIMFAVVIAVILLSYFIQQRNSEALKDMATQHSEFSIQALQNIEELQDKNIELQEQVEELEKQLDDQKLEWEKDVKDVEDQMKEDYNEVLSENAALCDLIDLQQAVKDGDKALAKEKAEKLEAEKDSLDEQYIQIYEDIAKTIK